MFIVFFVLLVFILKRFDFVEIISLEEKKFEKKKIWMWVVYWGFVLIGSIVI